MEKKETIDVCKKVLIVILSTVAIFWAVPMILLAMEVIAHRMMPSNVDLPFSLERLGLHNIENNTPGLFTTYIISLHLVVASVLYLLARKCKGKIERIASWAVFAVAMCVLVPSSIRILKETKTALIAEQEDRNSYMGIKMDELSRSYISKNGWKLTKHEECGDYYARSGEYYNGDSDVAYLDTWNPNSNQVYQAEKQQPVEPGTYRVICAARAEGPGVYIFATTKSGKGGVKLVEVPHYGNTEGEIWENAPEGSAEKECNNGSGFGWSKVVVTIEIKEQDTLVYGVTSDSKFTGKPYKSQWFSAADFEVERLGIN
jgi:hypothetical protein